MQPCIISKTPCLLLTVHLLGCHAMPIDASTCSQAPCMLRACGDRRCDAIDLHASSQWKQIDRPEDLQPPLHFMLLITCDSCLIVH
jgi:hypothetical protein